MFSSLRNNPLKRKSRKDNWKRNPALKDFKLVPDTVGVIVSGIWIKNDGSELKIKIAWKDGFLCFRPLKEGEKSLV